MNTGFDLLTNVTITTGPVSYASHIIAHMLTNTGKLEPYMHAGVSFAIYSVIGFFGASLFGSNTEGNILQNNLGGGAGQGVLNMAMSGLSCFTTIMTVNWKS